MVRFYLINNELDIDPEFNRFIDDQLSESHHIEGSWNGNTQNDNIIDVIVDRFNFFIDSGKLTIVDKQKGITEIVFNKGFYDEKIFDSHGDILSEIKRVNKWDMGRYHILRYHLVQDLKDKLTNLDYLDLDSLSIEYNIDKGFLIDFIYSFINKNYLEISSDEKKSLLRVKSNLDQILNHLDESLSEMELKLVA